MRALVPAEELLGLVLACFDNASVPVELGHEKI